MALVNSPADEAVIICLRNGETRRVYVVSIEGNVVRLSFEQPPYVETNSRTVAEGQPGNAPGGETSNGRDAIVVEVALRPEL
jgi:hypothetical protein